MSNSENLVEKIFEHTESEKNDSPEAENNEDSVKDNPTDTIEKEPTPGEKFEKALLDMMGSLQELGGNFGFNINDIFGLPKDVTTAYPYFELNIRTDDVSEEGEKVTTTLKQVSLKNGTDAAFKLSLDNGTTNSEGAAYFTGDQMLFRKADLVNPLIQYHLPHEGDGAKLIDMLPVNRYVACLLSDDPAQTYVENWKEGLDQISSFLNEKDRELAVEEKALVCSSLTENAQNYILHLTGEEAKTLYHAMFNALKSDFNTNYLLRAADNAAADDDDQLTIDTINDIEKAETMDFNLELCTVDDKAVAIFLNASSAGGTAQIEMISLGKEDEKAESFFSKFTHAPKEELGDLVGGYTAQMTNTQNGNIVYTNQVISNPGGTEVSRIEGQSENSGTEDNLSSNYLITIIFGDSTTKSSGTFTKKTSDDKIEGQMTGKFITETVEDGETTEDQTEFSGDI